LGRIPEEDVDVGDVGCGDGCAKRYFAEPVEDELDSVSTVDGEKRDCST
jgi:hypothetical protein